MDGRGTWRLSVLLLMTAAGCQHQVMTVPSPGSTFPGNNVPPPPDRSQIKPAKPKLKELPPLVWVKHGDFQAGEAAAADIDPGRRQELREQARGDYKKALKIDPKCLPAYQGLARLYLAMHDAPLAIETYRKALKVAPKNARLWYDLALCHNSQKNWGPALDCLSRAVQLDAGNRSYLNALGIVLAESGRYQESLNCFIRSNGEALGYYRLAQTLQRLQQPELSRRYFEAAVQKDPSLEPALAQSSGGTDAPGSAAPAIQQTAYQAPDDPAANVSAAPSPPAAPRVISLQTSQDHVPMPQIPPPPPPVNVPYEQPNP